MKAGKMILTDYVGHDFNAAAAKNQQGLAEMTASQSLSPSERQANAARSVDLLAQQSWRDGAANRVTEPAIRRRESGLRLRLV